METFQYANEKEAELSTVKLELKDAHAALQEIHEQTRGLYKEYYAMKTHHAAQQQQVPFPPFFLLHILKYPQTS